jgi:Transposase DDE domain group 1
LSKVDPPPQEGQVQPTNSPYDVTVADERLVSHAGVGLLAELADRLGLTGALDRYAIPLTGRKRRHSPARVVRDTVVMLADGGDCLSDVRLLAGCQGLLGPVASIPTAWRAIQRLADAGETRLAGLRLARAHARARAWRAGAGPSGRLIVDLDGSLIVAHTDRKHGADGTYKHTFGFHPLLAYLDHHNGRGEPLAAILRPGSAAANDTADHLALLKLALAQLPPLGRRGLLVRTDSRGATIPVMWWLHQRGWQFSVGLACDAHVRDAVLAVPDAAWLPAIDPDGRVRDGAWVAEVTGWLDLGGYPPGTRAICRRERPHPGAPLRFTDAEGRRYQVLVTNQPGRSLAWLELVHRQHARVEDRIRAAKATGLANLPFDTWARNAVWLELVLAAQDLTCWAQGLLLDGDLAVAEPKRLRTRLLHTAGRLLVHARRRLLLLPAAWPWAAALATAFARLRSLRLALG